MRIEENIRNTGSSRSSLLGRIADLFILELVDLSLCFQISIAHGGQLLLEHFDRLVSIR